MNIPVEVFGHAGVNGVHVQQHVGQAFSIEHVGVLPLTIHSLMPQTALVYTQCSNRAIRILALAKRVGACGQNGPSVEVERNE